MRSHKLSNLLNTIDNSMNGQKKVSMADIVDALERRGFGPLLVAPAIFTILPTGAIPGVPAICAVLICLVCSQIMIGRRRPWLPAQIRDFSISRKKLESALEKAKPFVEAIDDFAHPRYEGLTKDIWQRIIALVCILLAAGMAVIGFIPYAPALLSLPILLFAIGLSVHDGLLALSGFIFTAAVIGLLPLLLSLTQ